MNSLHVLALTRHSKSSQDYLIQWWVNKFRLPRNHPLLLNLTYDELYLDYLTDTYSHTEERENAIYELQGRKQWKGETSKEYEDNIRERLNKLPKVDLSPWQDKEFEDNYNE